MISRHSEMFGAVRISGCLTILTCLLLFCLSAPGETLAQGSPEPQIKVEHPRKAAVGKPIKLTVVVEGASNLGGYESNLLFRSKNVRFASLKQQEMGLGKGAREVGSVEAVERANGVSFGAFSCPGENCASSERRAASSGVNGEVRLATVTVVPRREGRLRLALSGTKLVDATGQSISTLSAKPFTIQVGKSNRNLGVPGDLGWKLSKSSDGEHGDLDLTRDGKVDNSDATEAAIAWSSTRQSASVCSGEERPADVNQDGCVDVGDMQIVASNFDVSSDASTDPLPDDPARITVNSVTDLPDRNTADGVCATSAGLCSLRAAIEESNARSGDNTIAFDIPGSGVQTIQISSKLPSISDTTGKTTIDGYTQYGASANTDPLVSNAVIKVQITPSSSVARDGLYVTSSGNTIKGLAMYRLRQGITLYGKEASGNYIVGNFVGTSAAGDYAASAEIYPADGISIRAEANRNFIGNTSPADRNVISGNAYRGVATFGERTSYNRIVNNIVGLSPLGDRRLPNFKHGIDINGGSSSNQIGGTESFERNLVSGNGQEGIEISHEPTTTDNNVVGNFVGTVPDGNSSASYTYNGEFGIHLEDRVSGNFIRNNVVGNNNKGGIRVGSLSTATVIENNRIGVSPSDTPIPNRASGIQIDSGSSGNRVGRGNIIAYNLLDGVRVASDTTVRNTITENSIFENRGLGIDLSPLGASNPNDAGDTDSGANDMLNYPELVQVRPDSTSGTACANCTVEVYTPDGAAVYGEGKVLLGSVKAGPDGAFSLQYSLSPGSKVTATATDEPGNTSEFAPIRVSSSDTEPPVVPAGLMASGAQRAINLDWQDSIESDLAGYNVYRSEDGGASYTKLNQGLISGGSIYQDSAVVAGRTYYYKVSAVDKSNNESAQSEAASAVPLDPSLSFDGINDLVAIPDSSLVNTVFSNKRTYEARITTGTDVTKQQFVFEEGGPTNGYSIEIDGEKIHFNVWANTSSGVRLRTVSAPVSPNTAYKVAGTYSNPQNQVALYINGDVVQTTTAPGGVQSHPDNTALGGIDGSTRSHLDSAVTSGKSFFAGRMDDFRIWNTNISAAQIKANAQKDLTGNEAGLVILYRMDEGSGQILNDSTQNNIDGNITGASWS